jgi:hypothetical protein
MALTFPSSPTNGQVYTDTNTGYRYIFDSNTSAWVFTSNNVGMSVSSTPPSNVGSGSMWYNREIGRTFVYYNDGDSSQWVETVPAGSIDTSTIASYVNPIYASLNANWTYTNTAYTFANIAVNTANTAFPNTSNVSFSGSFNLPLGTISIGTNAYPVGKFHVTTSNGEITRTTATGSSGGYNVSFFDNTTPWYFGSAKATIAGNINDLYIGSGPGTTNNLIFGTAGTDRLRINSDGVFASSIITSSVKTANIVNSTGSVVSVDGYPRQPGQIIEYISSPCDGSTVVGASGSYAIQNVTTSLALTDSFVDITGSTISYTPPSGATKVIFRFDFSMTYSSTASPIIHVRFLIDSTEVVYARRDYAWQSAYPQMRAFFEWPISIGGTSATGTTGRINTWTTAKTLKLQARRYSSSYAGTLHSLVDWDGSNQTGILLMPTITIIAVA